MKFHFTLQKRRIRRLFEDVGIHPVLGTLFFLVFSVITFFYLSIGSVYALGILIALWISALRLTFSEKRISFYSTIYSKAFLGKTLFLETFFFTTPIILLFLISGFILAALVIAVLTYLFLYIHFVNRAHTIRFSRSSLTIPTPFKKHPFEFTQGFRATWPAHAFLYYVVLQAIRVENFNLGLVAFLISLVLMAFYYSKPEPLSYVMIFNKSVKEFLFFKGKQALRNSFVLSIPFLATLIALFPEKTFLVLAVLLFGWLFILTALLSKYAYFPVEINLSQGIALAFCLTLPPLILIAIPIFYNKASTNLKPHLS